MPRTLSLRQKEFGIDPALWTSRKRIAHHANHGSTHGGRFPRDSITKPPANRVFPWPQSFGHGLVDHGDGLRMGAICRIEEPAAQQRYSSGFEISPTNDMRAAGLRVVS